MAKKELIHTRKIEVNCYETEAGRLIVEGFLKDDRRFPFVIQVLRTRREPGLIHHVALTMELTIPELKIVSLTVEMPVVPDPGCRNIQDNVRKLEGRCIQPGFTGEVRRLFAKAQGCLHLTNLVLAMSSAAVQGLWSYYSRVREGARPSLPETDDSILIDSCHMWRKDGPFIEMIRRHRMDQAKKR